MDKIFRTKFLGISSKILLVGGNPPGVIGGSISAEVISQNVKLPNLPEEKGINASPVMFHQNNSIIFCGGLRSYTNKPYKSCLQLTADSWRNHSTLNTERQYASSVTTKTTSYIFGGSQSTNTYESLEIGSTKWKLGRTPIPGGFKDGCLLAADLRAFWVLWNW